MIFVPPIEVPNADEATELFQRMLAHTRVRDGGEIQEKLDWEVMI